MAMHAAMSFAGIFMSSQHGTVRAHPVRIGGGAGGEVPAATGSSGRARWREPRAKRDKGKLGHLQRNTAAGQHGQVSGGLMVVHLPVLQSIQCSRSHHGNALMMVVL